ncbi:hypothetical protein ACSDR0_06950 [Streptosporangium sp. G11]|uniref:hypothetical protein n=1 Tax=Streptosporangium sp. G11 TaxID=3436926 RepID=UPI003EB7BD30
MAETLPAVPTPYRRLTLLSFHDDVAAAAREVAVPLLERRTPLSAGDRADVTALIGDHLPEAESWLPESVPARETRAAVLATMLPVPGDRRRPGARAGRRSRRGRCRRTPVSRARSRSGRACSRT